MRTIMGLAAVALGLAGCHPPRTNSELVAVTAELKGIMSTDATLLAVVPKGQESRGRKAIDAARAVLADVEAKMNSYAAGSELSRLNAAPVNQEVPLSPQLLAVLRQARAYAVVTNGVFDVTCRPLLEMWKGAAARKAAPSDEDIRQAMAKVGWRHFRLLDASAVRLAEGASIDLGGIAKKYAIDQAAEAMTRQSVRGGLVNVGGDVRCFGERAGGGLWQVGVRNPFTADSRLVAVLRTGGAAVCTSGNYERFVTIGGKRYSHIVDPRTGRTADSVPSVTVVGRTAVGAGVWATALCVLGREGLERMPPADALEAMIITGNGERYELHMTPGMAGLIAELLPGVPAATSQSAD